MQSFFTIVSLLLLSAVSFTQGKAPSAGACGPTSVANVPGTLFCFCNGSVFSRRLEHANEVVDRMLGDAGR